MADKRGEKEFAVIGPGRFGSSLARELEENGFSVMAIDVDAAIVQEIASKVFFTYCCHKNWRRKL